MKVVEPGTLPDGREATTPVVPVIVGEDWQAVLLWKALFEAGVYTNVAIHPAVPPGGALLRTSLMATHERSQLDRALEVFAEVKGRFPELPTGGDEAPAARSSRMQPAHDLVAARSGRNKTSALSERDEFFGVDRRAVG